MTRTQLKIAGVICLLMFVLFVPIETTVLPPWRLRVVDVNGVACSQMRVNQSWGHYRLYVGGNRSSDNRSTDMNGYVQFPQRTIRASLLRRIVMPVLTRVATIMHGGWKIDGTVWAAGIKDVAWLSYRPETPLPSEMRVEKCFGDGVEQ
jgi:hypothetical protein